MYLPRSVVQKVHGKKPQTNNFVKLLNKLSINLFLQYFGVRSKGRGARKEILLFFVGFSGTVANYEN